MASLVLFDGMGASLLPHNMRKSALVLPSAKDVKSGAGDNVVSTEGKSYSRATVLSSRLD